MMQASPNTRAKHVFGDIVATTCIKKKLDVDEVPRRQFDDEMTIQEHPNDFSAEEDTNEENGSNRNHESNNSNNNSLSYSPSPHKCPPEISFHNQQKRQYKKHSQQQPLRDATNRDYNKNDMSINKALNAVRNARRNHYKSRHISTQRTRAARKAARAELLELNSQADQTRREVLQLKRQLASEVTRVKSRANEQAKQEYMDQLERESKFNSNVYVQHKKTLEETERRRKRESLYERAKLRANIKQGEERMRLQQIEEDTMHFADRYESSKASRDYKLQCARKKRESMEFRSLEALRINQVKEELRSEEVADEQASFALKRAGEKDAEEYKRECAEERRRSMEFRTVEAKRHAAVLAELKHVAREREAESMVLKWAGEEDAKVYKREMEEERRRSLQFRNEEGVRHRQLDEEMRHMEMNERAENETLMAACKY